MRVIWSPAALREIEYIYAYIAQFNPGAAERTARRLLAAGDDLEHFTDRGRPVPGIELRELTVVQPYVIRYRIDGDRVLILRVRHGSRRP